MKLYALFRHKKYGDHFDPKAIYAQEEVSVTGSPIKRDPLLADLEDIDEFVDKDVHDKFNKHMAQSK